MRRVMVFQRDGTPAFELDPADVLRLERYEKLNGEHSLEIETRARLSQGQRVVYRDGRGIWREYAVYGLSERRDAAVYYCTWSVQPDLMGSAVSAMPGTQSPVAAALALDAALSAQNRWTRGDVTRTATGGASMYDMSAWQALGVLVDNWGGELAVETDVDPLAGEVTARRVSLLEHVGQEEATRRFDFGADLVGVERRVADGPLYCRISPRGKGEQTEGGGYGRKIRINHDDPTQPDWLEYAPMVDVAKLPDGNGGWEYPTLIVENGDIEDPAELRAWAESALEGFCTPEVTYELDCIQAAREGVDAQGVSLGDEVHVVDAGFGGTGLRLSARVVELTVDELADRNTKVVLGSAEEGIESRFSDASEAIARADGNAQAARNATADLVANLLDRINAQANANGGYTYILNETGGGIRTYDDAVTDPEVGSEASAAVEIKGGVIRIANSREPGGGWDWRTALLSGQVITEQVTTAALTTGFIGAPSGNYWNLDTGELRMAAANVHVGGDSLAQYVGGIAGDAVTTYDNALTQMEILNRLTGGYQNEGMFIQNGHLYIYGSAIKVAGIDATLITTGQLDADLIKTGRIESASGTVYFDLDNNELACSKMVGGAIVSRIGSGYLGSSGTSGGGFSVTGMLLYNESYPGKGIAVVAGNSSSGPEIFAARFGLTISAVTQQGDGSSGRTGIKITDEGYLVLLGQQNSVFASDNSYNSGSAPSAGGITVSPEYIVSGSTYSRPTYSVTVSGGFRVFGHVLCSSLSVGGTKSRLVDTNDYGERLLYSYETPAPMFGDIGSGVIGDDGLCYVEIDDVFSETVRTDIPYQVFLQKCGPGDLWVAEKAMTHFVVEGTPGLAFDWELKAKQAGFELTRIEEYDLVDMYEETPTGGLPPIEYPDYVTEMEQLYSDDIAA